MSKNDSNNSLSNNNNYINPQYDVDKLNFKKIKKELQSIPKIIKKNSKMGIRSSSMTDISKHKYDYTSPHNSKSDNDYFVTIKKENLNAINNIKKIYEQKINDVTRLYEEKISDLNKLLQDSLNEFKNLSCNYISLIQHNNIIQSLKQNYNEVLNETKNNYENLISELTDIMKYKNNYQDLLERLQFYKINQVDIEQIESKLFNDLKDSSKDKNYLISDYFLLSQLEHEIVYHKKLFEIKQAYTEKFSEVKNNRNFELDNLIKNVNNLFDYLYNNTTFEVNENNNDNYTDNNKIIKNTNSKGDVVLEGETINYESMKQKEDSLEEKENDCGENKTNESVERFLNYDTNDNPLKPQVMDTNFKLTDLK